MNRRLHLRNGMGSPKRTHAGTLLLAGLMVAAWLPTAGCKREEPPPAPAAPAESKSEQTEVAAPDVSGVLAELTQAVRKFSAEKQQVPASLDMLVTGGYITRIPSAPGGKQFVIDQKNVRVILK